MVYHIACQHIPVFHQCIPFFVPSPVIFMVTLVIDSFLSVWGISVFDAFSSKPLLPKFHAQFIRKDNSLLYPLVGWSSLYLKKSFVLLFLFSFKCSHWLQLNEDLEGHIDFLAQTGPFSVPIRCVTKKCQVFSCRNHHPLTTQLWYCCATSWGYYDYGYT